MKLDSQAPDEVVPPIAVIDIGSNSIRLVVYEGAVRAPVPIFNEKILCGLGQNLNETGHLDVEGVERALLALPRFIEIAQGMKVAWIEILATAAVREAENGPDFVNRIEETCKVSINILTGREEARLAGLGVLAGTPEADGVAGDLGGGSVELVRLSPSGVGDKETLPLGPLRLGHLLTDGPDAQAAYIDQQLDNVGWMNESQGRDFYVVGGAWRNIAKIHMAAVDYPLHVIHHYTVPRDEMLAFTDRLSRLSIDEVKALPGVSKRRANTLSYAALLMNRIIEKTKPEEVVFSANGVREGCVFEHLSDAQKAADPLLAACHRMPWARTLGRVEGDLLSHWIEVVFNSGVDARHKRLQSAACLLSEVGRLEHPDYRVDHALTRVMRFPFVGLDHADRAFLALAVASRYGKTIGAARSKVSVEKLLSKNERALARATGFAMRLAFAISGGVSRNLKLYHLERDGDHLRLVADSARRQMMGEVVERRLASLADALGCTWSIEC